MSDPRVAGAPVKDIEYVYTSYHPTPESPDEAQPNTGEGIEAIVNDDPYGDGWLQVSPPRPFGDAGARGKARCQCGGVSHRYPIPATTHA